MTPTTALASSRREFLKSTGAVIVTFAWPTSLGAQPARETSAAGVDAWLAIAADGAITLFTGKVEIGTGVSTALAQIVAEELDVRVGRVGVIQGDTERTRPTRATRPAARRSSRAAHRSARRRPRLGAHYSVSQLRGSA